MTAPNAALPILDIWRDYFLVDRNEGLGSSYERIMLNRLLSALCQQYGVTNALEAPSFGFTGLSGINSLWLTKQHGVDVTLADTNQERLELIQQLWREANVSLTPAYIENYSALPFADQSFQFSWNFAAIWLLDQPEQFLRELTRVTRQVILIAVPNQHGLGYYMRKWLAKGEFGKILHESAAVPQHLIAWMDSLHWKMVAWDYLDVPSWPDIAMKKEDFTALLHLRAADETRRCASRPALVHHGLLHWQAA